MVIFQNTFRSYDFYDPKLLFMINSNAAITVSNII